MTQTEDGRSLAPEEPVAIDPPLYQVGMVEIDREWLTLELPQVDLMNAVFGVQVHPDGRVWICVDGMTFIRFKPVKRRVR